MSKRRSIWPDLLTDRRRRKTSMEAMCLYYDLLMCVDDQGIYPLDVDKIILEVVPYFRGDDEDVERFLGELVNNRFIEVYTPKGHQDEFLLVLDWHQQGAMSSEYNKYPNKDGIVNEGKKRLGGMQRVGVIKSLAAENDNTCQCCGKKIKIGENQKISDVFTITERVNTKSRGSKYAENYSLLCKECSKTQRRHNADTEQTQCVTSVDTDQTHIGLRDKGLGLRDKGLGLRDKDNSKQEVASASNLDFPFLSKIPKKNHEAVQQVLSNWSEVIGIKFNPAANSKINKDRAKLISDRLSEGYTVEQCFKAIDGCSKNEFNMATDGKNKTAYNDIKYIFTSERIERHINHRNAAERITEARSESVVARLRRRRREAEEVDVTPMTGQNGRVIEN